jgi:hypothetical protein
VKARDIIPGWPRGRSTVVLWPDWECAPWLWLTNWKSAEGYADWAADREYHEAQQRMTTRFLTERFHEGNDPAEVRIPLRASNLYEF